MKRRFVEDDTLVEAFYKKIKIGNFEIGSRTFIIAEIGINHNGDIEIAKKLIDKAKEAGADAVKFQKKTPELCVPEDQKKKPKETPWGHMTYLEYKERMELSSIEYGVIDQYCKDKGIMWFASPWDTRSVDFLEQFKVPCYKIASPSLTDDKLLKKVKETKKPIILSTGMSTLKQIDHAVKILGKDNLILMHCNSSYPSKYEEINLKVINTLQGRYNVPVGYSGHETGLFPSAASVMLGAVAVERHITLDRTMWGTDHAGSVEPQGFEMLVRDIRKADIIQGDGKKRVYPSEKILMEKMRN